MTAATEKATIKEILIVIFSSKNKKFQCMKMKFSCHDFFMHETFCRCIVVVDIDLCVLHTV